MAYEFKLPDIGEGIAEGEITKWFVKPGDVVKEDQPLCEVMTDKATVEVPSPVAGKVLELRAKEGETVPVESVLVVLDTEGKGDSSESKEAKKTETQKKEAPQKTTQAAPAKQQQQAGSGKTTASYSSATATMQETPAKVLAAPATRKLARELGVDISTIRGSGPHGRVTKEDVQRQGGDRGVEVQPGKMAPGAGIPIPAPMPAGPREEKIQIVGLRRRISEQMRASKDTAAHFTYVDEVDVTELVALRKEVKERAAHTGVNITFLPFIMKALVEGLRRYPWLNATADFQKGEVTVKRYYNFGIAVDTDRGLIVPVIKDVDRKSIFELARDVQDISTRTRDNKIKLDELQGGTFTITNAGNIGGLFATPVINIPEVAILGVHKIKRRPWIKDEQVVIRDIMYLSISIDHRVVDGATGARFMNEVVRLLENPTLLFLGVPA